MDTATRATAVALQLSANAHALEARDDPPAGERPRHATRLLALIAELLQRSETSLERLDRIAVGVGPGTFTGLRIGIATARALSQARGIPLVGVSTLHSLALGAEGVLSTRPELAAVLSVLDARRGEVFVAGWAAQRLEQEATLSARALRPDALTQLLEASEAIQPAKTLAIGEGALAFRAILERTGVVIPDDDFELHRVTASNHCRLARSLPPGHPDEVHPCYLRLPDAERPRHILAPAR